MLKKVLKNTFKVIMTRFVKLRFSKVIVTIASLMGFCLLTAAASAGMSIKPTSVDMEQKLPSTDYLGVAKLANAVQLPAYQASYSAGWSDKQYEIASPNSLKVTANVDPKLSDELALYYVADLWVLIPKNWQLTNAAEGANGSYYISFAPPNGQKGHFIFESSGACYGCGVNMASQFFKTADKLNQADYGAKTRYRGDLNMVNIRPHTKAWRATIDGQNIDGLAFWNADDIRVAQNVQVSLPKSQAHLATPILNWWLSASK